MENGEKKLLPKSKGQSIMISGFMCACHGFMSAEIDSITYKSHQYFQAGSGYAFTNAHINEQFRNRLILCRHYCSVILYIHAPIHIYGVTYYSTATTSDVVVAITLQDPGT